MSNFIYKLLNFFNNQQDDNSQNVDLNASDNDLLNELELEDMIDASWSGYYSK